MITNEKELENYIIEDDDFCKFIEELCGLKYVSVVDNQVHVGDKNIIDVLCIGLETEEKECLVVVELKFRPLEAKDFAQVGRYITALLDVGIYPIDHIQAVLIGTGVTDECAYIINGEVLDDDIKVAVIENKLSYYEATNHWFKCIDTSGQISPRLKEISKEKK